MHCHSTIYPVFLAIRKTIFFAIVLVFFVCTNKINAQESLYFNRFLSENSRIERGLSQNTIYSIYQDDEGFMWFGSWDGLNRFDGYTFLTFNKEQGLSNEAIRAIYQEKNVLWVGTEDGLNAINLDNGHITNFFAIEGDSASLSDNWINHITSDHLGKLWISTASGLTELDTETLKFRQVFSRNYGNPLRSNYFNMMAQDENNNYWIATNHGLVFYETGTHKVTRFFHIPGDSASLPDNHVNVILFDEAFNLWVGTKNGTASYDKTTKSFSVPNAFRHIGNELNQKEALSMLTEPDGKLWIGTNGQGLYLYDKKSDSIQWFANMPNRSFSLSDNRVFNLYRDRFGMLWIGTFNGLNKLNNIAPKFRTYRSNPDDENSLSNNSVWCFEEDDDKNIWIGTEDGISIFNRKCGDYKTLKHQKNNPNSISGNQIRTIKRDSQNRFWIGTRYNGLTMYDSKTEKFKRYLHDPRNASTIPDDFVLSLATDTNGMVWVGTYNGLGLLNPETNVFTNYKHHPDQNNSLPDNIIYGLFHDSKNRLWICTADGLAKYQPESNNFRVYKISMEINPGQYHVSNKFFSINEDHSGTLWIGTRSGGLVSFDTKNESFKVYSDKDGLPNNVTYLAIEDLKHNIWITTNWGLTRFSADRTIFTNYEVTDGLQSNEFNFNAGFLAKNGELFFGGMNGFTAFFPEDISINTRPPEIKITSFKLFNEIQNRRFKNGDTLFLKHNDNVFSFEFTALDFTNPSRIKYRYKLENYNSDWIERSSNQRFAEYARVSPGEYNLRITAANSDGFWNEKGISLVIIIQPPWYETWLFRAFVLLLIIFLIYLIIYTRMKSIRSKHAVEKKYLEFEKKLFELEQKALQLQMNPHFLFNSLNSIQSFIVNSDIDNAIHYLSKFSQLMRRTLSNSRESYVPLRDELQALQLYIDIEKLRFNDKFEYNIIIDPEIDESFIEIPPMILQPYVENAIIHGLMHKPDTGHLLIELKLVGDNVQVIIRDDGVGREKAAEIKRESGIERKSRGMLITSERLEILNQYTKDTYTVRVTDHTDDQGKASGTSVEVTIHANLS
jgi:ligand-binding sensor domain-containing protein